MAGRPGYPSRIHLATRFPASHPSQPNPDQLFDQRSVPVLPTVEVPISNPLLRPQHGVSLEAGAYHGVVISPGSWTGDLSLAVYQIERPGEGVIVEVLGPQGEPHVETFGNGYKEFLVHDDVFGHAAIEVQTLDAPAGGKLGKTFATEGIAQRLHLPLMVLSII